MSQLTLADCWPRRFPLLAGAAVLRGSHPGGTAAVCQSQRRRGRRPALAGAAGIGGAGELSSVYGSAGGQRAFCRARLAGMASPLRRRSGAQGPGIINLSLAWPVQQPLGEAAEPIYHSLCAVLQRTARFGVASHARAVSGSFAMAGIILPAEKARRRARLSVPPSTGGRWRRAAATWCWPMR